MMSFEKIRYASITDVGVKRSHNQDACAAQPAADENVWRVQGHIFVVADGMGGHAVGEKASAKAIRDIPLTYSKHVGQEGVVSAIRRAFTEANADIFDIGIKNPEFKGLGTTTTALFLRPEGAWIGHVGDSRAYRIRSGKVEQLTFDHSWVWEIARRQGIDPDQLGDFKKNVIVRSLGPDEEVEVDIEGPHPLIPGDSFLLCSDGLSNEVTADEMGAVVSTMPPEEAAKFLIALANVRGGRDNITCLIVQVPPDERAASSKNILLVKGPGFLRKALRAWDRIVPWSYTFLLLGSLCAMAVLILKSQDLPGVVPVFFAATVLILAGIVGLILHLKHGAHSATDAASSNNNGELHVYKGYSFDIGQPLFDRFAAKEAEIKIELDKRPNTIDWSKYQKLSDEAALNLGKSEPLAAFRYRCLAFQLLASAYNQDRNKEESFKPNWDSQHR